MRKCNAILLLLLIGATYANAAKLKGSTTLKDLQPAGTKDRDKKGHQKHQQFDFTFVAAPNQYLCRTDDNTKLNATDFVVGSEIAYEIDKDKVKLKSTSSGKETKCTVVRVEATAAGF
jgi:hypothetical protein